MLLNERDSTCASPPLLVATHSCQDVVAYRDSIVSISKQKHGISVRTEVYTAWNDTMALGKRRISSSGRIILILISALTGHAQVSMY